MKNQDLISVIVPIYNVKFEYIKVCIESILNQNYENFEIILVDDGSNEKTSNFLDELATFNPKIKIFHKQNGGVSSARNFGLTKISNLSKYVLFIDSDDFVDTNYIECLLKNLKNHDADLAQCNHYYFDSKKEWKRNNISIGEINLKENQNFLYNLITPEYSSKYENKYYGAIRGVWGKIFKTDIIKINNIIFDGKLTIGEDAIFVLDYLKFCSKIYFLNEYIYHYRIVNNSIINSYKENIINIRYSLIEKYFFEYEPNYEFYTCINREIVSCYFQVLKYYLCNKKCKLSYKDKIIKLNNLSYNVFALLNTKYSYDKSFLSLNEKLIFELIRDKHFKILYLIGKIYNFFRR